jgi:hypothetical protein
VRIDGKPRHHHIAVLVSFTEVELGESFADHCARLCSLGERVPPDDRECIEAAVAKKLPRPTKAKLARVREERSSRLRPTSCHVGAHGQ